MGMTIDDSLEWLISRKEHYEMDDSCQELAQALDTAISTMRKYEKIKEIVDKWNWGIYDDEGLSHAEAMDLVSEVVEDGVYK